MTQITVEEAEGRRKARAFAEASAGFACLWEEAPSSYVGWRYAYCLRKLGQLGEAEAVARTCVTDFPEDAYARAELGRILFEKELKPAAADKDLERLARAANSILVLEPGDWLQARAVLSVMRVAKERGKWAVVLAWSDRVTTEALSDTPYVVAGRRNMPDRETWYIGRSRAMLELERYEDARNTAQMGLREFSNSIFLARVAALALARSGDLAGGIGEIRALLAHPRAAWYMKAELAEFEYQAGAHQEAYRLICDALAHPGLRFPAWLLRHPGAHCSSSRQARGGSGTRRPGESDYLAKNWRIPAELTQEEQAVRETLRARGRDWPQLPLD